MMTQPLRSASSSRVRCPPSQEKAQNVLNHVVHVVPAAAQVRVFHLLEDLHQAYPVMLKRPLGAEKLLPDQLPGRVYQGGVLEHEQVRVDELGDVDGGRVWNLAANGTQRPLRRRQGLLESRQLSDGLVRAHVARGDRQGTPVQ